MKSIVIDPKQTLEDIKYLTSLNLDEGSDVYKKVNSIEKRYAGAYAYAGKIRADVLEEVNLGGKKGGIKNEKRKTIIKS